MNVFTEVYDKSVEVLAAPFVSGEWKGIAADLKALLESSGPNAQKAGVLDNFRKQLAETGKTSASSATAVAAEIVKASVPARMGFQDRAAMIKTVRHFYAVQHKGAQSVWVLDPPKGYSAWPYDLFAGKSEADLKTALADDAEVFGAANRTMMSDASQLARKWAADAQVKLASPNAATLQKVRSWFHLNSSPALDVAKTAAILAEGCKQIHAACNSTQLIFSDRPHLRASGKWDNAYASVNQGDVMQVIYIFQVFLDVSKRPVQGSIPRLWLCALTIIHELSHKLLKTEDFRYDDDGLRPGTSFTPQQALKNADSWGYFVADLLGAVPGATLKSVLA